MPTNYKLLYEQMGKMLDMYQDEIVPQMREMLDKRVEVVRCKDCKYWKSNGMDKILCIEDGVCCCNQWENDYFNIVTTSDDFCSYGERKEDENAAD